MEKLERAAKEYAGGVRHYEDRKQHAADDFKAGALWLAERLCHVPLDKIVAELNAIVYDNDLIEEAKELI